MLDMTEGPCRMRKKMMRNDLFYLHYPYRPELDSGDNKALKYKVASSWDSKEFYQKYRPQSLLERDRDYVLEAQLQPEDPADKVCYHSHLVICHAEVDLPIGPYAWALGVGALWDRHVLYQICNFINFLLSNYSSLTSQKL